ncbi:hypothetical protein GYMLUDRAFT_998700 [Collybiopsis luxurians FD-317 M1]|uniref:Uncharacterized protein n=1 Tax=Collybiopsis luxurians FD-317 M1 TaxID=944289 RepID=A0A0D0CPX9_9AGAR|nr:hypothetical protein GYMLUDRAFT_998700 [Collybiopsis luxurians FD-317 M1]
MRTMPDLLMECTFHTLSLITFKLDGKAIANGPSNDFPFQDMHLLKLTPFSGNLNPSWSQLQELQILCNPSWYNNALASTSFSLFTNAVFLNLLKSHSVLKSCKMLFPRPSSFTEAELDSLQRLKECGLRLSSCWTGSVRIGSPDSQSLENLDLETAERGGAGKYPRFKGHCLKPLTYPNMNHTLS